MSKRHTQELIRNYASESGKKTPSGPCPRFGLSRKSRVSSKLFKSPLLSPATPILMQTPPELSLSKTPGRISSRKKAKKNLQDDFNENEECDMQKVEPTSKEDDKTNENIQKLISSPVLSLSQNINQNLLSKIRGGKKQVDLDVNNVESTKIDESTIKKVIKTNVAVKDISIEDIKSTTKSIRNKNIAEKKKLNTKESVKTDSVDDSFQILKPKKARNIRKPLILDSSTGDVPLVANEVTTLKEPMLIGQHDSSPSDGLKVGSTSKLQYRPDNKKILNAPLVDKNSLEPEAKATILKRLDVPKRETISGVKISETLMSFSSDTSDDLPLAALSTKSINGRKVSSQKQKSAKNKSKVNQIDVALIDDALDNPTTKKIQNRTSIESKVSDIAKSKSSKTDKPSMKDNNEENLSKIDVTRISKDLPLKTYAPKLRKSFSLKRSSNSLSTAQKSDSDDEFESSFHKKHKRTPSTLSESSMVSDNDKLDKKASDLSEIEALAISSNDSKQECTSTYLSDELLKKEIASLQIAIKQKQRNLDSIKQASIYRNMHKVSDINELSKVWEDGCKNALIYLHQKLTENDHQISMEVVMQKFNVPRDIFKFDAFNYCFL